MLLQLETKQLNNNIQTLLLLQHFCARKYRIESRIYKFVSPKFMYLMGLKSVNNQVNMVWNRTTIVIFRH